MKKEVQFDISNVEIMSKDKSEIDLEYEIQLLYAMQGFKPVGISKHFQMTCIIERLQESIEKTVSSKIVWDLLNKWYNLKQLDENELIPFENQEIDFNLPDAEYGILKQKKSTIIKPVTVETKILSSPQQQSTHTSSNKGSSTPVQLTTKKSEPVVNKESSKSALSQKEETKKEITPDKSKSSSSSSSSSSSTIRRDSQTRDAIVNPSTPKSSSQTKKEVPLSLGKKLLDSKRSSQNKNRPSSSQTPNSSSKSEERTRSSEGAKEKHQKEDVTSSKRTTRGSLKPDEANSEHSKSQSPLTVSNTSNSSSSGSAPKRRRI